MENNHFDFLSNFKFFWDFSQKPSLDIKKHQLPSVAPMFGFILELI